MGDCYKTVLTVNPLVGWGKEQQICNCLVYTPLYRLVQLAIDYLQGIFVHLVMMMLSHVITCFLYLWSS